ncbi:ovarian carcinoma antigen [Anaeramoeba flamelloides]|uniref:Ovarian carcinoma antigen n=1 Tax=Anaeramoeba flamelloides TaxID=1746091 RepID=A0AAV7YJN2_9EUKA|nr:ovarian carcinoma antigen [Anaeramoeba flamelloides]
METVSLKIIYNDAIRRINLPITSQFDSIKNQIFEIFSIDLNSSSPYILKYEDDEGDQVSLTSTKEFIEALKFANKTQRTQILRIYILKKLEKKENNQEEKINQSNLSQKKSCKMSYLSRSLFDLLSDCSTIFFLINNLSKCCYIRKWYSYNRTILNHFSLRIFSEGALFQQRIFPILPMLFQNPNLPLINKYYQNKIIYLLKLISQKIILFRRLTIYHWEEQHHSGLMGISQKVKEFQDYLKKSSQQQQTPPRYGPLTQRECKKEEKIQQIQKLYSIETPNNQNQNQNENQNQNQLKTQNQNQIQRKNINQNTNQSQCKRGNKNHQNTRYRNRNNKEKYNSPTKKNEHYSKHCPNNVPVKRFLLRFVKDLSYPDKAIVKPGQSFRKGWQVRNEGDREWPCCARLIFIEGNNLGYKKLIGEKLNAIKPDQTMNVYVDLVAPTKPGNYTGYWRAYAGNQRFGHRIWCNIIVRSPSSTTSSSSSSFLYNTKNENENENEINSNNNNSKGIESRNQIENLQYSKELENNQKTKNINCPYRYKEKKKLEKTFQNKLNHNLDYFQNNTEPSQHFIFQKELNSLQKMGFRSDKNKIKELLLKCNGDVVETANELFQGILL